MKLIIESGFCQGSTENQASLPFTGIIFPLKCNHIAINTKGQEIEDRRLVYSGQRSAPPLGPHFHDHELIPLCKLLLKPPYLLL
jgi:hypothetical protein